MWIFRTIIVKCFLLAFKVLYKIERVDIENIPKEGAYVLISNHIHWKDPLIYAAGIKRNFYAIGKEELFSSKIKALIMKNLAIIPVKRDGTSGNQGSLLTAIRKLNEGNLLLIYPEGTRMGLYKGIKPKKGAALLALEAKVPIIPMAIVGSFKPFSKVKFKIGKPIDISNYYPKDGQKVNPRDIITITNLAMEKVIELRDSIQTDEMHNEMMEEEEKRQKKKERKNK